MIIYIYTHTYTCIYIYIHMTINDNRINKVYDPCCVCITCIMKIYIICVCGFSFRLYHKLLLAFPVPGRCPSQVFCVWDSRQNDGFQQAHLSFQFNIVICIYIYIYILIYIYIYMYIDMYIYIYIYIDIYIYIQCSPVIPCQGTLPSHRTMHW